MLIAYEGVIALRRLRLELQDSGGAAYPQALHTEMLVLYDVCRHLQMTIFQCREVLGEAGLDYVTRYMNGPMSAYPLTDELG